MTAKIVYGVVFGKQKVDEPRVVEVYGPLTSAARDVFSDDVFYMSPPIDLPCDSEPTNEPA